MVLLLGQSSQCQHFGLAFLGRRLLLLEMVVAAVSLFLKLGVRLEHGARLDACQLRGGQDNGGVAGRRGSLGVVAVGVAAPRAAPTKKGRVDGLRKDGTVNMRTGRHIFSVVVGGSGRA